MSYKTQNSWLDTGPVLTGDPILSLIQYYGYYIAAESVLVNSRRDRCWVILSKVAKTA